MALAKDITRRRLGKFDYSHTHTYMVHSHILYVVQSESLWSTASLWCCCLLASFAIRHLWHQGLCYDMQLAFSFGHKFACTRNLLPSRLSSNFPQIVYVCVCGRTYVRSVILTLCRADYALCSGYAAHAKVHKLGQILGPRRRLKYLKLLMLKILHKLVYFLAEEAFALFSIRFVRSSPPS